MAHNALVAMQRDRGILILSLGFDEHTGRAGLLTRLEAFVDILERRRERLSSPSLSPRWRGWASHPIAGVLHDIESKLGEGVSTLLRDSSSQGQIQGERPATSDRAPPEGEP